LLNQVSNVSCLVQQQAICFMAHLQSKAVRDLPKVLDLKSTRYQSLGLADGLLIAEEVQIVNINSDDYVIPAAALLRKGTRSKLSIVKPIVFKKVG
jgi:hypothetical protein